MGAGNAHVVEGESAVVDTGKSALISVVFDRDARQGVAGFIAYGYEQRVYAVINTGGDEAGEHDCRLCVAGRVADVLLIRRAEGGVDDELLRFRVVLGGRGDRCDIGAVADFRHRERAQKTTFYRIKQPRIVLFFIAQVLNRAGEQADLHTRFDLQGRADGDDLFEHRDVLVVLVLAAEPLRQGSARDARLNQLLQAFTCCFALFLQRPAVFEQKALASCECTAGGTGFGAGAVQQSREDFNVEFQVVFAAHYSPGRVRADAYSQLVSVAAR